MKAIDQQLRELVKAENYAEAAALIEENDILAQKASVTTASAAWKTYLKLGNTEKAELWLDRGLQVQPENPTLLRGKGDACKQRQEWLKARDYYAKAAEIKPEVASFHASLSFALDALDNPSAASDALACALAINGTNRSWWIRQAQILLRMGELRGAADAYAKALDLDEDPIIRATYDEILYQIRNGTQAASEHYYDDVYSSSAKYAKHGINSVYAPVWERIIAILREQGAKRILDLGCGPGQFAEFLSNRMPEATYTGVDFSAVAISQARQRCSFHRFEKHQLPMEDFSDLPDFDAVICTEVLEHVDADCDILAFIPVDKFVIISVPNFRSFGHLRIFRDADEVRKRYGTFLEGVHVEGFSLLQAKTLWLMWGTRVVRNGVII